MTIMNDTQHHRSGEYHSNPLTSSGFELLKRLYDVYSITGESEHKYIRDRVNSCVVDKRQDFATLLTEIDFFMSLRDTSENVEIGDSGGHADIRIIDKIRRWDIECKSVEFSFLSKSELRGFCSILNTLLQHKQVMDSSNLLSAWFLGRSELLTNASHVRDATNDILHLHGGIRLATQEATQKKILAPMAEKHRSTADLQTFLQMLNVRGLAVDHLDPQISSVIYDQASAHCRWAVIFYSGLDMQALIRACQDAFDLAMLQHDRRKSGEKIVLINIECLHVFEGAFYRGITTNAVREMIRRQSNAYGRIVADGIAKKSRWPDCLGLILVFAQPPYVLSSGGTGWERMYSWYSPSKKSAEEVCPPIVKMLKKYL